jgi:hypothetical protein
MTRTIMRRGTMIVFKRIPMTKYLSRIDQGKEIFDEDVWCPDNAKPDTPYYKIRIKIIKTENRYSHERPEKKNLLDWFRRRLKYV